MLEYNSTLNIINICLLMIGNLFFSLLILKRWRGRYLDIIVPIVYPLVCTIIILCFSKYIIKINEPLFYILFFIISIISLILLLKIELEEAVFLSISQCFHIILAKSISAGAMSLALDKNMFELFQIERQARLIYTISYAIISGIYFLYFIFITKKKMQSFFLCKGQVLNVLIVHIIITIYLLFKLYNFYYNIDLVWFSIDQIYTSIVLYIIYFLVLKFASKISSLLQNEIRTKTQDFKILSEMATYIGYKDAMEFISLYKGKASGLKVLINTDKKEEALTDINILDKKIDAMMITQFRAVSNIDMINALFYQFLNECSFKQIKINYNFFIPNTLDINDKTLHEVLSCLLKNALEASLKIAEKINRKINITTEKKDDIFIICVENAYESKLKLYNGAIKSSKVYTELEGLGIGYITQALEKGKGELIFDIDEEKKIFKAKILIKYSDI